MEDTGSTEVVYKIRQWSLPGAAIVLVLNVSSRVFWLELDDKALLDAILCYRSGLSLQLGPFLLRKSQNRSLGRLQAKHLWMEVKLRWRVLADRMCTKAPAGKSKEEHDALLFDTAARHNHTDPFEEKSRCGAAIKEVQTWWKQCKECMAHFKEQSEPFVFDFKIPVEGAIRKGSRSSLKPDVRDSPEDLRAANI